MMSPFLRRKRRSAPGFLATAVAALVLGASTPQPTFAIHDWVAAVSGLTSESSKWDPMTVPGLNEPLRFNPAGVYTVTFAVDAPQSGHLYSGAGVVTLKFPFNHSAGALIVTQASVSDFVRINRGTLNISHLHVGDPNGRSTLVLEPDGNFTPTIHSDGADDAGFGYVGDQIGYAGVSEMYLYGGSRYICERTGPLTGSMHMARQPSSQASLTISGIGGLPAHPSLLSLIGGASLVVGEHGTANLSISNRGILTGTGPILVGFYPDGSGFVSVGAPASTNSSYLNAQDKLIIGGNLAPGNDAGHGEVTVKDKAFVTVTGICEVGDADNDTGSILRVQEGGTFTANGGLKVWPTLAGGLDLQSGLTHMQGGAFEWPAGKYLAISSQTGTPELLIDNGMTNTGPSTSTGQAQLFVARDGDATVTIAGSGTEFVMGQGSTSVGDLSGGIGLLTVDAGATFSTEGQMIVGNHGYGVWYVQGGAVAEVGTLALGVASGGHGGVIVEGTGSELYVEDNLWLGGGFGGAGGGGVMTVKLGGRLEILHVNGGVNPALTNIYLNGTMQIGPVGVVTTTGDVSCAGDLNIWDSEIEAQSVTLAGTGDLRGYGTVTALLNNGGRVDPGFDFNQMYAIPITGGYTQYAQGHYTVDLDASEGPQSDLLQIDGPATLAGFLHLRPETGFVATPGLTFRILTCTSRTGTFDSVTWLGVPLNGQVDVVYGATYVDVVVPGATAVEDLRATRIRFAPTGGTSRPAFALDLPDAAQVWIRAYDVRGREVATLFEGHLEATTRSFDLEGSGRNLASGVYFARAEIQSRGSKSVHTARVVLVH